MDVDEVLELAHRSSWRYKKSSDPNHSDTYTFNRATVLEFARKVQEAERNSIARAISNGYQPIAGPAPSKPPPRRP